MKKIVILITFFTVISGYAEETEDMWFLGTWDTYALDFVMHSMAEQRLKPSFESTLVEINETIFRENGTVVDGLTQNTFVWNINKEGQLIIFGVTDDAHSIVWTVSKVQLDADIYFVTWADTDGILLEFFRN